MKTIEMEIETQTETVGRAMAQKNDWNAKYRKINFFFFYRISSLLFLILFRFSPSPAELKYGRMDRFGAYYSSQSANGFVCNFLVQSHILSLALFANDNKCRSVVSKARSLYIEASSHRFSRISIHSQNLNVFYHRDLWQSAFLYVLGPILVFMHVYVCAICAQREWEN